MKIKLKRNNGFRPPVRWLTASFGPLGYRVPQLWILIAGPIEVDVFFSNWLVRRTQQVPEPCDCGEWPSGYGCPCDVAASLRVQERANV